MWQQKQPPRAARLPSLAYLPVFSSSRMSTQMLAVIASLAGRHRPSGVERSTTAAKEGEASSAVISSLHGTSFRDILTLRERAARCNRWVRG